ncbi:MAG TPA: hypothetical protein VIX17_29125 [Pyrinomonadaceae bacterium]|jgi:hypothetical protein
MGVESGWDRHGYTITRSSMATRAGDLAHSHMTCMIKRHIEAM